MKSTILLASVALFAGLASAGYKDPSVIRSLKCRARVRQAGVKCKRGDMIHIKRDEDDSNKFHVAVSDTEGNEINLPKIDVDDELEGLDEE